MTTNVISLKEFFLRREISSCAIIADEKHPGLGAALLDSFSTHQLFHECCARMRAPDFQGLSSDAAQKILTATEEFTEIMMHVAGMIDDGSFDLAARTLRRTCKQREILLDVMPELRRAEN